MDLAAQAQYENAYDTKQLVTSYACGLLYNFIRRSGVPLTKERKSLAMEMAKDFTEGLSKDSLLSHY